MLRFLFLTAVAVFLLAYRFYGRFQSQVYGLDEKRKTPAEEYFDGMDYVPAHPSVLLGHHFSSIAGAGPVVGPITAGALFGWLPTYLWCLVGSVFLGGVHDLGALVASIRHRGLSMGEVVECWIGHRGKKLFLSFTWLALILLIAVFLELAAGTFAKDPAVAFSGSLYILLALVFGVLIYRFGLSLLACTLVMLPLVLGAVFYGSSAPWVTTLFSFGQDLSTPDGQATLLRGWRIALIVYIFLASVLPVWLLLQPRDYLASYLLYFSVALGTLGMLFGNSFNVRLPAVIGLYTPKGDFLWPMLFVVVACGAISGFHALVGSGTTSKQLRREKDALFIGYGGMLIEGLVAVVALGTLMIAELPPGGAVNPLAVYGAGIGRFAGLLGIDPRVGASLGLLALNSFILTSLDTATRLARYQLQEFFDMKVDRYTATATGVGAALFLVFFRTQGKAAWQLLWPLFGASNQLVAALALLAMAVWVRRGLGKNVAFLLVPMGFMFITTLAALLLLIRSGWGHPLLGGTPLVLLGLALLLAWEARQALGSSALPHAGAEKG
ncbi:carbon starvation CstA family protein [Aminomonas paucivorans]|uniref:carbon starvation CstA family protein n=1 Tax=Aminomonas paucivorans TaxID=81412 RepID=UPI003322986F